MGPLRRLWHKFLEFDRRLHSYLLSRYPSIIQGLDAGLDKLVAGLSNPLFGLLLALVLVVLEAAGVRIPVLLCLWGAWAVSFLLIARNERIRRLSIGTRLIVLCLIAAILGLGARRFGEWALRRHETEEPNSPNLVMNMEKVVFLNNDRSKDSIVIFVLTVRNQGTPSIVRFDQCVATTESGKTFNGKVIGPIDFSSPWMNYPGPNSSMVSISPKDFLPIKGSDALVRGSELAGWIQYEFTIPIQQLARKETQFKFKYEDVNKKAYYLTYKPRESDSLYAPSSVN